MTNQEAIKELEWIYQNGFSNDLRIVGTDYILDSIRKGIDALEKQIPQKSIKFEFSHHCPYCDNSLNLKDKFCVKCGQKIAWSEEVEE